MIKIDCLLFVRCSDFVCDSFVVCFFNCVFPPTEPAFTAGELREILAAFVVSLLDKRAGDNNPRCATSALEFLQRLSLNQVVGPKFAPGLALSQSLPPRKSKKVILARLRYVACGRATVAYFC